MKLYIILPLAALLAFAGYRWSAVAVLRQADADRQAAHVAAHAATLKAEHDAQQQALAATFAAQEQRKQERADQAARDLADQAARQAALDHLDAARRRAADLARQLDRLKEDLATEGKAVAGLETAKTEALAEQSSLRDLATPAGANLKNLSALVEKLAAAAPPAPALPVAR